ncbi:MAG: phosphoribosylanthranilate isomerase [Candidatus Gracilibacteria bacterium]|nr:phosphoribosylanthranilate isomerase [Candidatus Gracilibacteria bacterium]
MKKLLKICGIRKDIKDYDSIDFLGFNFIDISKRKIAPDAAKEIKTPKTVKRVGLFGIYKDGKWQNLDKIYLDEIIEIAKKTNMSSLQIYGNCDFSYLKKHGFFIIKPISYKEVNSIESDNNIDMYIIEAEKPGRGKPYDYEILKDIKLDKPFLVAGGIDEFNLAEVLKKVPNATGVDIASGVDNGKNVCRRKTKRIIKIMEKA